MPAEAKLRAAPEAIASHEEIVSVDIGGTHARFALARIAAGRVAAVDEPVILKTAEHGSLELAWNSFAQTLDRPIPKAAAISIACPVDGEILKMANNPWVVRPGAFRTELGLERHVLINDFGAVGHAVAQASPGDLQHICGPDVSLPTDGIITVLGPGTGLGVAHVLMRGDSYFVNTTEGGHIDFAPLDSIEDAILRHLRARYRRVSVERIIAGPGLANIVEALAVIEGAPLPARDDRALWQDALSGAEPLARAGLERFCLSLGAVSGDLALAQGAKAVVIAGGVGARLASHLPNSAFGERFVAKGRFESMMAAIPVKLITTPEPGLFGAAAAFAKQFT
ncbi:glucokinase [Phenylobacterium deserti]|uniref:Glucokinase n=1 Tax=Phenylobacterium deserti TaxID=1914756 RepID=A0A328AWK7_9CAUL|nr:glucokinase [Phenylobacterium deserti]RAK57964.1 glucokinase [Phenylobacterium deserti]